MTPPPPPPPPLPPLPPHRNVAKGFHWLILAANIGPIRYFGLSLMYNLNPQHITGVQLLTNIKSRNSANHK
jgi:hypothetical protein